MQAGGYSHLKNGFNSSVDFFLVRGRLCLIPFVQLVVLIRGRFNSSVSTVSFIRRLKVFLLLFEFVHLSHNDFSLRREVKKQLKPVFIIHCAKNRPDWPLRRGGLEG